MLGIAGAIEAVYVSPSLCAWRVGLDCGWNDRLVESVSGEERSRAGRFRNSADSRRFIASRAALRYLLGAELAVPPADIRFDYTSYGKPYVASAPGIPPLSFSCSRSSGVAAIAIAADETVGIDIERIDRTVDVTLLARRVLSAEELEAFAGLPTHAQAAAFYDWWTLKEAVLKAIGTGLSYPLTAVSVDLADPERPIIRGRAHKNAVKLVRLIVAEEYAAALAVSA